MSSSNKGMMGGSPQCVQHLPNGMSPIEVFSASMGRWVKKVKENEKVPTCSCHMDIMYSIGNTDSNIVITLYVDRWSLGLLC